MSIVTLVQPLRADEIYDPLEPVNRGIFWFNDRLDVYVLEQLAQGYENLMPQFAQDGVDNFFKNIRFPVYFVSDLVQLKFSQALDHTGRFVVNTTVGVVGLVDVAQHMGLPHHEEDFGLALAYHGVPPGPYIVIPFLGPSTVRDGFGRIVDSFLDPFMWLQYSNVDSDITVPVVIGAKALDVLNTRSGLLEAIRAAKESSVDYYGFLQSSWYQHRRGLLYDGEPPEEEDEFGEGYFDDDAAEGTKPEVFPEDPAMEAPDDSENHPKRSETSRNLNNNLKKESRFEGLMY